MSGKSSKRKREEAARYAVMAGASALSKRLEKGTITLAPVSLWLKIAKERETRK